MIVFLYGSDAYRLKQSKDDLVSRYKSKYPDGMSYFNLDLSDQTDIDQFESALRSSSFFNEHKLIVCKNIFNKKPTSELITEHIKEQGIAQTSDITLVVVENLSEKDLTIKSKELFKLLSSDKNIVKNIEPLSGTKLTDWAKKEFETRGCSIEFGTINSLINTVGNDSWAIINEIDKLTSYKTGRVTSADIQDLVHAKFDMNIFDLIDALAAKNRPRAVELLYRELKTGRDSYYVLTMIIYQFRNILIVKGLADGGCSESEIVKKSKLHPFVVKKTLRSPIDIAGAVKTYGSLLAFDTGFKTGKLDLENSLYSIILS